MRFLISAEGDYQSSFQKSPGGLLLSFFGHQTFEIYAQDGKNKSLLDN